MMIKGRSYELGVVSFIIFFLFTPSSLPVRQAGKLQTPNYCYAQSISSTELINNAKDYDGKTIAYEGEVIGDIMGRGDYAWINVNDGNNAIGVWLNKELTKGILYTASYKIRGDWIEVKGTFQRACPEHGGDLDIHAQAITKIKAGSIVSERIDSHKLNLALGLLGVLVLAWILRRLKRK